jgi:hypothetical protein
MRGKVLASRQRFLNPETAAAVLSFYRMQGFACYSERPRLHGLA